MPNMGNFAYAIYAVLLVGSGMVFYNKISRKVK